MPATLELIGIRKSFGGHAVLDGVDATAPAGSVTAFVGPNGAGKTTLLQIVAGAVSPDGGRIVLDGTEIHRKPTWRRARMGIGRHFQESRVYLGLSALDNLLVTLTPTTEQCLWSRTGYGLQKSNRVERAQQWLERVGLGAHQDRLAGELSLGQRKLLSLACLFALNCRVLLLDEPTAGLSPAMVNFVTELILLAVDDLGASAVLVEHNMQVVSALASSVYFMHGGRVVFTGTSSEVLGNARVRALYVGL